MTATDVVNSWYFLEAPRLQCDPTPEHQALLNARAVGERQQEILFYVQVGLVIFAATAATVYALFAWVNRSKWWPRAMSMYVEFLINSTDQPSIDSATVRSTFNGAPEVRVEAVANHSHPKCAAARSSASETARLMVRMLGKQPYMVQTSPSDVRKGLDGSCDYHWAKDMSCPQAPYAPGPDHVPILIDTDMYMDIPDLIGSDPRFYVISTPQPSRTAYLGEEYSFCFLRDNTMRYIVSGGAEYKHQIWIPPTL